MGVSESVRAGETSCEGDKRRGRDRQGKLEELIEGKRVLRVTYFLSLHDMLGSESASNQKRRGGGRR